MAVVKYFGVALITCLLVGCLGTNTQGQDEFYTWVDERGQVHTLKKQTNKSARQKTANAAGTDNANSQDASESSSQPNKNTASSSNDFDPRDFASEETVQARLKDSKLFSWTEDGRQQIIEQDISAIKGNSDKSQIDAIKPNNQSLNKEGEYRAFREGEYLDWEGLIGREIQLGAYYQFHQELNKDYFLIDVSSLPGKNIQFKTFIHGSTVALPQMVFLSNKYSPLSIDAVPFEFYTPESWYGYGYLSGSIAKPGDAVFLLIYTSDITEALSIEDKVIKVSNLGRISFTIADQ